MSDEPRDNAEVERDDALAELARLRDNEASLWERFQAAERERDEARRAEAAIGNGTADAIQRVVNERDALAARLDEAEAALGLVAGNGCEQIDGEFITTPCTARYPGRQDCWCPCCVAATFLACT